MIRKLRLKLIGICLLLVSLVLGTVFGSVYHAARLNLQRSSREVLERVIWQDGVSAGLPGENDQLQLPYFTVGLIGNSSAYLIGGTYYELENTEELQTILNLALEDGKESGDLRDYHLRYLRVDNGVFRRIAFVDTSLEHSTLQGLVRSSLQIGLLALLVLLALSSLLARWATRPVEQSMARQTQFLADASHELKTPLTVILSNAELLAASPLEERPARWADNIGSEARQMKTLVEEMLTLARMEHTTVPLSRQCLSELAEDCLLCFEPLAFESGKSLQAELAPELFVLGNGDRLRRLIAALLDNAVKYAGPAGKVGVRLWREDKRALLEVSNSGSPIPPEQRAHLFERFYRADASRGETTGFGLGLPIAEGIAREHRGSLRVESDAQSTRFTLTLPLAK